VQCTHTPHAANKAEKFLLGVVLVTFIVLLIVYGWIKMNSTPLSINPTIMEKKAAHAYCEKQVSHYAPIGEATPKFLSSFEDCMRLLHEPVTGYYQTL